MATTNPRPRHGRRRSARRATRSAPLATLARRRLALTARTPRELLVPLLTPILFALVIAPGAEGTALHTAARLRGVRRHRHGRAADPAEHDVRRPRRDRRPRDRRPARAARRARSRGRCWCSATSSWRSAMTALQVVVLIGAARAARHRLRRRRRPASLWFVGGAALFTRRHVRRRRDARQPASRARRSTSRALPAIAIVPWFFAGSLFPISALPRCLDVVRQGSCRSPTRWRSCATACSNDPSGLHDIWGMHSVTDDGRAQPAVVAAFAAALTAAGIRLFTRSAVG